MRTRCMRVLGLFAAAVATGGCTQPGAVAPPARAADSTNCSTPASLMPAWATGYAPTRELYASPTGSGDGTLAAPMSWSSAVAALAPGVRVNLLPGTYACIGDSALSLGGGTAHPAAFRAVDAGGKASPLTARLDCMNSVGNGIYLSNTNGFIIEGLEILNAVTDGIHVDSGGATSGNLSSDIVVHRCKIHDIGRAPFKANQAHDITVIGNELFNVTNNQDMDVEFVAVDNVVVAGNYAHDSYAFDEVKGGSQNALLFANTIVRSKSQGIIVGGYNSLFAGVVVHTDADYEALHLSVVDNVIDESLPGASAGDSSAMRVVGCHDCVIANNTYYSSMPSYGAVRFLHDNFTGGPNGTDVQIDPANIRLVDNIFVFATGANYDMFLLGNGVAGSGLVQISNNLYLDTATNMGVIYSDVPYSGDSSSFYSTLPGWVMAPSDFHLRSDSPVLAKGAAVTPVGAPAGFTLGDADGQCWQVAPSIGAYQLAPPPGGDMGGGGDDGGALPDDGGDLDGGAPGDDLAATGRAPGHHGCAFAATASLPQAAPWGALFVLALALARRRRPQ